MSKRKNMHEHLLMHQILHREILVSINTFVLVHITIGKTPNTAVAAIATITSSNTKRHDTKTYRLFLWAQRKCMASLMTSCACEH